MKVQSQG